MFSLLRFVLSSVSFCAALAVAAIPASALPLDEGDVVAAFFARQVYEIEAFEASGQSGDQLVRNVSPDSDQNSVQGLAVDDQGRILSNIPASGLAAIDRFSGESVRIGDGFDGYLEPNVAGRVLGRSADAISLFDSSTDTFAPIFDLSSSVALGGATVRGVDSLADGTLLMVTSDSIFSLAPGASDVSVLSSGGLLTEPLLPGFPFVSGDVAVTADGRILVATFGVECEGCAFTTALLIEIDPVTGAQTVAYNGARTGFQGQSGLGMMAVAPNGAVYIGGNGARNGSDVATLSRLFADGTSEDLTTPAFQFIRGVAVLPVPEPSTALLLGLGLSVLAGRRSGAAFDVLAWH